jgi:hypothetical protein
MVVLHDALSAMDDWKFHEVIWKVCIPHADRGVVVREHLCAGGRRKAIESNDAANFIVASNFTNTDSNTDASNFIVAANFIVASNFTDTGSNSVAANNNRAGVRTGAHVRSWLRGRAK